jgi:hypothetical protein
LKSNLALGDPNAENRSSKWTSHGQFIKGSSQTWLAVIGPHVQPLGEIKQDGQLYQQQLAQTIAHVLGEEFTINNAAPPVSLR